jgi:Mn-dependent DtxR family transcriptional regulator
MLKQSKRDRTKDLAEELDVFDTMLSALIEILEEKGITTQEEWEERIKIQTIKAGGTKSYRDIQFSQNLRRTN